MTSEPNMPWLKIAKATGMFAFAATWFNWSQVTQAKIKLAEEKKRNEFRWTDKNRWE